MIDTVLLYQGWAWLVIALLIVGVIAWWRLGKRVQPWMTEEAKRRNAEWVDQQGVWRNPHHEWKNLS